MPKSFQYTPSSNLLGIVPLSDFTIKPVFARSGTVEFPHDKPVFFNKVRDGPVFVGNAVEPLVLVNVTLDNVHLSVQDIMKMFTFVEHGEPKPYRYCLKS
jgi:hypothetical protein